MVVCAPTVNIQYSMKRKVIAGRVMVTPLPTLTCDTEDVSPPSKLGHQDRRSLRRKGVCGRQRRQGEGKVKARYSDFSAHLGLGAQIRYRATTM